YVSTRPEIEVFIETNNTFNPSGVKIYLYKGASVASGVWLSSDIYTSTDETNYPAHTIKFRYNGPVLSMNETYVFQVYVEDNEGKPATAEVTFHTVKNSGLYQFLPYPSPYNPNSGQPFKIKYAVGEDCKVDINIYDRAGKLVSRVVPSLNQVAGEYVVDWNARNYAGDSLANGVYICEIKAKGSKEERKYMSFAILRK
ncbi:MAG: T9SS type A sorting domain-containing protein, partial [Endomicrobium sp.]|nr:T9SS type A sorting domain-containing protein [Endomicrobium sp.]